MEYVSIAFSFVFFASIMMLGVFVIDAVFEMSWLAAVRRALCESPHRWLAFLLPFSPAITAMTVPAGNLQIWFGTSRVMLVIGLMASCFCTSAFAGYWLGLPREASGSIHHRRAVCASVGFWVASIFLLCASFVYRERHG